MDKALENKTFISTRPQGQNDELKALIGMHGGKLLELPTITITPNELESSAIQILQNINQFSWIVFTSPNGIRYFFKNLENINGNHQLPPSIKTAVVGNKTLQVLKEFGHQATLLNPGTTGAELAKEMLKVVNPEEAILFPEGDLARSVIAKTLSKIASCTQIVLYRNKLPETIDQDILQIIVDDLYHSIILTSPSSFNNLVIALNNRISLNKLRLICIGTTTANEVIKNNIKPISTAAMTSSQGIVDAILQHSKQ